MIYLDMDGVLADFDAWLRARGIVNENSFIHKPKEEWTPEQHELDKLVVEQMKTPGFFRNLPPMRDAHELWNFCRPFEPIVLTARPKYREGSRHDKAPDFGDRVAKEKREWIEEQFGAIPDNRFICCLRSEKQNFIGHTHHTYQILVDDLPANITDWNSAGGIGVLHTSAEESIRILKGLVH